MANQLGRAVSINKEWAETVINWELLNGRKFSWRENRTPYRIMVAEVLLKRTTSTAAFRLYEIFLQHYPNIISLNNASYDELILILKPIGLYNQRAKHLKQIAEYVLREFKGEFPKNYELLLKIPGVGDYTASAILSFSYNQNKAIVDSNVERILKRVFNVKGKELKNIAEILANNSESDTYNYGMLDLGALICHYRYPKCPICPLRVYCSFYKKNKK